MGRSEAPVPIPINVHYLAYYDVGVSRRQNELAITNCSARAWRHHRALTLSYCPPVTSQAGN